MAPLCLDAAAGSVHLRTGGGVALGPWAPAHSALPPARLRCCRTLVPSVTALSPLQPQGEDVLGAS